MGKTLDRKSLKGRRVSISTPGRAGHENENSNAINVRSVLTEAIRLSGSMAMYRRRVLNPMSSVRVYRRIRLANSRRQGFYLARLRRQHVRPSNSTRRVADSTRRVAGASIQGRQRTTRIINSTEPQLQGNQFPRSNNNQRLLKTVKIPKPLGNVQMASCSKNKRHLKNGKYTGPLAHELRCSSSIASLGLTHIFHNEQDPLTEGRTTTSLIIHAIIQTIICLIFYFWLRNFPNPENSH